MPRVGEELNKKKELVTRFLGKENDSEEKKYLKKTRRASPRIAEP